jgi:hypothetical protein
MCEEASETLSCIRETIQMLSWVDDLCKIRQGPLLRPKKSNSRGTRGNCDTKRCAWASARSRSRLEVELDPPSPEISITYCSFEGSPWKGSSALESQHKFGVMWHVVSGLVSFDDLGWVSRNTVILTLIPMYRNVSCTSVLF